MILKGQIFSFNEKGFVMEGWN